MIAYYNINSQQDQLLLQHDLNIILKWTETWLMELNTSKCVVLTCSRLTSSSTFNYTIRNYFLQRVTQHPYLGILLDSKMSFSPHINQVISKAARMLNFVKRNLYRCSAETKCLAYTSIVRLFYTICVFCTVRVWYVPYAYGTYHTRTVRFSVPYAYGIDIRVWYVPYAYYAFSQPCHHLATMGCLCKHF